MGEREGRREGERESRKWGALDKPCVGVDSLELCVRCLDKGWVRMSNMGHIVHAVEVPGGRDRGREEVREEVREGGREGGEGGKMSIISLKFKIAH